MKKFPLCALILLSMSIPCAMSEVATATTISITQTNQSTLSLFFIGNITDSQITNATLASNVNDQSTSINFTIKGAPNTFGNANFTVPKNIIRYGTIPRVLVEGHLLTRQEAKADQTNYYISLTCILALITSHSTSVTNLSPLTHLPRKFQPQQLTKGDPPRLACCS